MFQNEKIIEIKTCKFCNISFEITDKDLEFYEKISPIFDGKKYLITNPTLCPDCRQQRRLSFRNERNIYKRKCDFSGKDIISIYSPDKKYKVYDQDIWWSDKWDPLDYGMDFDFNKSFFEQFDKLMKNVPKINLSRSNSENCEYTNIMIDAKNCYLSFASSYSENVAYSTWTTNSKTSIDCLYCDKVEELYECIDCSKSYKLFYCSKCIDCNNCFLCKDCKNCQYCYLCYNLNNKSYFINNVEFSKEDYFKEISKYKDNFLEKRILINSAGINRNFFNINTENCIGDYILNSKDCYYCFGLMNSENCRYCTDFIGGQKDCIDCSGTAGELCKECLVAGFSKNSIGCVMSVNCNNIFYCEHCFFSSNLFGCVSLKNKEYCILNKQYTKEEYEKLVPKIIEKMQETGEWGEFFPSSISPFGYNETVANEYFPKNPPVLSDIPLIKGDNGNGVEVGGFFNWSFYEAPFPKVEKIIKAENLPDDISKIPDDILNWAIMPVGNDCIVPKPFRIIKQELEFYRKHNLPIPKIHPDQRHLDRMKLRNPRKLFERVCDKCGKNIKTTYSPDIKEIIYCESCYKKEVY